ncbi:MAG: hypothetical protein Q4B86_02150 [Eubacteriales bacterium]|nr:hypothetical protein [Eubacteriales bacterium]
MFISFFKILFFIILTLLAVILLIAMLLLFVPFRYELNGSYIGEKLDGEVKVSWLARFVCFDINYHEGIFVSGYVRIMGICIFRIQGKHIEKDDICESLEAGEESL